MSRARTTSKRCGQTTSIREGGEASLANPPSCTSLIVLGRLSRGHLPEVRHVEQQIQSGGGSCRSCAVMSSDVQAYDATDKYSTLEQREVWVRQLSEESSTPPITYFHPLGHLIGLSGSFAIAAQSADAAREWLLRHAAMLGIGPRERLVFIASRPFYEVREVNEGEFEDILVATSHRFAVQLGEGTFVQRDILAIVRNDSAILRGIFNGHIPAVAGYGPYVTLSESSAQAAAEASAGASLTVLEARQGWFDPTWAQTELPGTKDMHWLLKAETPDGRQQVFAIRNIDASVTLATSGLEAAFSLPQYHRGYLQFYSPQRPDSRLYWTNINPGPQSVCLLPSADCTNPALNDSFASRGSWPEIVDIWHERSQPGGSPPLQWKWPWSGTHKSPFDNRNRTINSVLAHTGSDCSPFPTPCSTSTTYWFGPGDINDGVVGHEYGHRIVAELKSTQGGATAAGKLTEAMCDLFGVLSEDYRLQRAYPCTGTGCQPQHTPRTDFRFEAPSSNLVVDWQAFGGNCSVGMRAALGRAFHASYSATANFTIPLTRDAAFNAWQVSILRAYEMAPDAFPVASDLHAASVAQLPPQPWSSFPSPGPAVNLYQALQATGCFP